ncbi:hypothetical protein ANRL3_01547 [Anaerolineae bacterium]|nr:hypothetical protein ANRL3_01547 [Anaerolineae bacterium]
MSWKRELAKACKRFESLGSQSLKNGARLIGHVPHFAPEGYLFEVFDGLGPRKLKQLETHAGRKLPKPLAEFYSEHNGMHLFAAVLSIYGLRESYVRRGDAARQPFDIDVANRHERPEGTPEEMVYFGFYSWDGSQLAMTCDSPRVIRVKEPSMRVLNEWPTFDAILSSEIKRLSLLHDDQGRRISRKTRTTP